MTAPAFDLLAAVDALDGCADFRVLRRFVPRARYHDEPWNLGDKSSARVGVYVDVETTGLDVDGDEIIELAFVPFAYDAKLGLVYDVRPAVTFFEEPRRALPEEITEITGITREMVQGQRIDDAAANEIAAQADLLIAHNADFDRRFVERRLPAFAATRWACSQREVPWTRFGVRGSALPNILMTACGEFAEEEHRAAIDCAIGVHCLAAAQLDGRTALSYLLDSARAGAHRVCALRAPMEAKGVLRARQYHALYVGGRFQYWHKEVAAAEVDAEMEWCRIEAFASPALKVIHACDRYSVRADQ